MAKYSILPDPDVLNEAEYGRFVLTNLAAKRAMQIKDGAPPLVRIESSHPLSIALAEIAQGKIKPLIGEATEAVEEEPVDSIEDLDTGGLLLPSLDDEGVATSTSSDEHSDEVAATSTALLANLLGDGDEEESKPDSESSEISLEDLAAQEEGKADEATTE